MIIPIRTDSPLRTTPWMNWLLIAANVAVFILSQARPDLAERFVLDPHDPGSLRPGWLAYITYAFLHAGVAHLVGNMIFLYIFGNNVNDRVGNFGYLGFYLAGAVFAGIGHVLVSDAPVVGASGAVAAVTGAYLVLLPRSHITVFYFWIIFGIFEMPSLWLILIFFLLQDVVFLLLPIANSNVAHMAHVAGTLFGIGSCTALLALKLLPRDQFDVLALLQRWNRRRQFRAMVSRGYDPFGYSPQTPGETRDQQDDPVRQRIGDLRAQISQAMFDRDHGRAAALYQQILRLDDQQVLARSTQLDVANQLAHEGSYADAAVAYELYLRHYGKAEQIEQVQLMVGLIYARYLQQPDRAREHLTRALTRLYSPSQIELAREELARLQSPAHTPGDRPG